MSQMLTDRILAAVRSLPMFRGLPEGDRRRIEEIATLKELRRGDVLWNAGDPADALTLIVKGRVKIVRHGGGADMILEIFGEGEPVGAVAVYNRMPYPASAVALDATTVLQVPSRDYFALLERHPDLSRALISEMTRLYTSLARKLEDSRSQRVEARIAQLFLSLAERMGRDGEGGTVIAVTLSRQEVAEMVGTTVESSIRVLSRWGRSGVLVTGHGRFVIPSLDALRSIAEGRAEG
jgi:CRP/FNR family transcriptional regulator